MFDINEKILMRLFWKDACKRILTHAYKYNRFYVGDGGQWVKFVEWVNV